jgi:hypothetical protein
MLPIFKLQMHGKLISSSYLLQKLCMLRVKLNKPPRPSNCSPVTFDPRSSACSLSSNARTDLLIYTSCIVLVVSMWSIDIHATIIELCSSSPPKTLSHEKKKSSSKCAHAVIVAGRDRARRGVGGGHGVGEAVHHLRRRLHPATVHRLVHRIQLIRVRVHILIST